MTLRALPVPEKSDMPVLLAAAVGGVVLAVLIVINPLYGLAALGGMIVLTAVSLRAEIAFSLLVLSFAIPVQRSIGGVPLNMADGVIVLWGVAWPLLMLRVQDRFSFPFVARAALPLVVCAALSLFTAINPTGSAKQLARLIEIFIVVPLLMVSLKNRASMWRWITAIFLIVPCLFAIDGVVEYFNHGNSITKMLHIYAPLPSEEFSSIRHTFDVSGRAGSTFGGAQGLAMYLAMMLSIAIAIILVPPVPMARFFALAALCICTAGLFFAKSRGGFMGCGVLLLVMLLATHPRVGIACIVAGGMAAIGGILWFLIIHGWDGTVTGLVPGRPEAVLDRMIIWSRAIEVFSGRPLLGAGFGGFRDVVYDEGGINLYVPLGYESLHCHNTYLEILTGTGLLGFIAYLSFLGTCWVGLIHAWRKRKGLPTDCFILAGMGALAAYMTFGMVDMLFLQNIHYVLISILTLAMIAASSRSTKEES